MAPNWHAYITDIEGQPASVAVDAAAAECDRKKLRHLIVLRVQAAELRDNAFPSQEDFESVYALEEQIEKRLAGLDTRYVGRLTVSGLFFLHFYSARPDEHVRIIEELAVAEAGRGGSVGVRDEPDWASYSNVLYPSSVQWQQIGDEQVLAALGKEGDDLAVARQIDHWFYFETVEARDAVAEVLADDGFSIDEKLAPSEEKPHRVLRVSRSDVPAEITVVTSHLLGLADKYGGKYDGWETTVTEGT